MLNLKKFIYKIFDKIDKKKFNVLINFNIRLLRQNTKLVMDTFSKNVRPPKHIFDKFTSKQNNIFFLDVFRQNSEEIVK